MTNLLITPEEISLLARPCHVDEQKAIAYIVEAELNNIKPALGDDLFLRLKRGENRLLLEGGEYERDGKLYYIAGVKRALAYYVYSRLLESGSVDLTRQGVVNRRSEFSDEADEREKISVSRETYTIADRYMQEIAQYIGGCGEATETSQRTRMKLIGGSGGDNRKYHSTTPSGNISPSSNINVVHTLGDSTKDVVSQAGVTREFNALRDAIKNIEVPTLPELAKVATSGDYNDLENKPTIPSVEGLASVTYVDEKVSTIKVPKALSELSQDASHRLVTDTEKATWSAKSNFSGDYNDLKNKPNIPSLDGYATEQYVQQQIGNINTILESIING